MDNTIEELQQKLQEKVTTLDKERAEQLASLNTEQEKRRLREENIRVARAKQLKEQEERVAAQKVANAKAETERLQKEAEERIKAEAIENERQASILREQEEARKIQEDLLKAEFAAEQHRKAVEAAQTKLEIPVETDEVDTSHILTGEAAVGTGGLEVGPELSPHMRRMLRRSNSEVN